MCNGVSYTGFILTDLKWLFSETFKHGTLKLVKWR